MDVQLEKTGPCNCKLEVTVPAEEVDTALAKAFKEVARSARIPGFRPGKAPRHVLEMHFGQQVRSDVENDLVRGSLPKALVENEIAPVAQPRVEAGNIKRGTPFSYTAEVEIQPEIKLEQYEGLEVPIVEDSVTDDDLESELEKIRQQAVQMTPVLDHDFVKPDDLVLADYHGTVGGTPLEGAKAENTLMEIGKDEFLPGISEALMGVKVPGKIDVPIDFPEDHTIEAWRNVKATFHVELKELKKRALPDLDDDFAKDLGEESLEGLREKLRGGVEAKKRHDVAQKKRRAVLEALVEKNPFDVPPSMVAEQVDRMIVDAAQQVRMMMGPSFDVNQLDVDKLRESNRERAEFQVRSGLLMLEVAKATELEIEDDEIQAEIDKMVDGAGDQAERVRAQYQDDEARNQVKYKLLEDKTIEVLLEKATLVDAPEPENTEDAAE